MRNRLLPLLAVLLIAGPAMGSEEAPSYVATFTTEPPRIDGRPDEPVWDTATPIEGFIQQEPDTGVPASERTVVKVLYDHAAIYFAAFLYDPHPITAKLARRDSYLAADWFAVYLDTHHDHRTARMFRVNPLGVQRDSLVEESDEENRSWDAVWESAAAITGEGWTAEIRIPYSQLRFPPIQNHTWGINFHREVARNNEYTRLVHVPRNESGFVARFAHLTGIAGIHPPRRLEVLPYLVGKSDVNGAIDPANPLIDSTEHEQDAGLDLKYGLSSNLTLSLTLNPDFGQVEADPAEVNLSEFELFFEERRPFFLEGADLFAFTGTDLFYSRRIGRTPQGAPAGQYDFHRIPNETTILGAAKLSGRTADGWSIGILDAVTSAENAVLFADGDELRSVVEPRTNYLAARVSRDFGEDSRLGGMLTSVHRDNPSHLEFLHDSAYTGGIDGYRYFGARDYVLRFALLGSHVRGSAAAIERTQRAPGHYYQRPDASHIDVDPTRTSLQGWGADTFFEKRTGKWRFGYRGTAASPGLELNDIGFRMRADTITTSLQGSWVDPEPRGRIRSRSLQISKADRWNFDGDQTLDRWFGSGQVTFMNYWEVEYSWRHDLRYLDDRLTRGGPLALTPAVSALSVGFSTDRRKAVSVGLELGAQDGEMGASRREVELELSWQPRSNLDIELQPAYISGRVPLQFVTRAVDPRAEATYGSRYVFAPVEQREFELTTRLDWAITRTLTVQLYAQPLIASGDYQEFRELLRPASLDYRTYENVVYDPGTNRYVIDPDGEGEAPSFGFGNPDFNLRSLRGNLVGRWEFRPGSALYVVWSQDRDAFISRGEFDPHDDFRSLADLPEDDVYLIKLSYWFGL